MRLINSANLADRLTREADPVEALRAWLHAQVRLVATKKGMIGSLQLAAHGSSELKAYSFERLTRALSALLERGVAARCDLIPTSLPMTCCGRLSV